MFWKKITDVLVPIRSPLRVYRTSISTAPRFLKHSPSLQSGFYGFYEGTGALGVRVVIIVVVILRDIYRRVATRFLPVVVLTSPVVDRTSLRPKDVPTLWSLAGARGRDVRKGKDFPAPSR